jgi:hypothetical protein
VGGALPVGHGKHNRGREAGHRIIKGIGGQVGYPLRAQGRDPGDGAGGDDAGEQVVGGGVRHLRWHKGKGRVGVRGRHGKGGRRMGKSPDSFHPEIGVAGGYRLTAQ